jgi:hypothetical protein
VDDEGRAVSDSVPNDSSPVEALAADIAATDDVTVLMRILGTRYAPFEQEVMHRNACRRLIGMGVRGIDAMYNGIWELESFGGPKDILSALWDAEHQRLLPTFLGKPEAYAALAVPIDQKVAVHAARRLRDLLVEAVDDVSAFHKVIGFAYERVMRAAAEGEGVGALAVLLGEATIRLTLPRISEFAALVDAEAVESRYQDYLRNNPVFLDPLAAEVLDQHQLGDDLRVDFVVRRHDVRYIAVEIKRPQDKLFTEDGHFRAAFVSAFDQTLDYVDWIDNNNAYAQKKLPAISAPTGLVVIGLRSRLPESRQSKLRAFNMNSRRVEVATYDDLVRRARTLYQSLRYGAIGVSE